MMMASSAGCTDEVVVIQPPYDFFGATDVVTVYALGVEDESEIHVLKNGKAPKPFGIGALVENTGVEPVTFPQTCGTLKTAELTPCNELLQKRPAFARLQPLLLHHRLCACREFL